jgi:hypothetical protein
MQVIAVITQLHIQLMIMVHAKADGQGRTSRLDPQQADPAFSATKQLTISGTAAQCTHACPMQLGAKGQGYARTSFVDRYCNKGYAGTKLCCWHRPLATQYHQHRYGMHAHH